MRPHLEKIVSPDASFLTFERNDPQFPFYWHYHPEFELTLIVDSTGQRLVGDGIADYGPGDLVLLGPNLPHTWRSGPAHSRRRASHRAVVVQFRQNFAGEQFFSLKEMESVSRLLQRASSGLAFGHTHIGRSVARNIEPLPRMPESRRLVTLLSALVELAEAKDAQVLSTLEVRPFVNPGDQHRIDRICHHLNRSFHGFISYPDLAKKFHMSQASLCRFFRRATGRTLTGYVNQLRVAEAAQLIIESNQSTLDICFRCGFGNYSNFNRQFKRLKGISPSAMRRNFRQDSRAKHLPS